MVLKFWETKTFALRFYVQDTNLTCMLLTASLAIDQRIPMPTATQVTFTKTVDRREIISLLRYSMTRFRISGGSCSQTNDTSIVESLIG